MKTRRQMVRHDFTCRDVLHTGEIDVLSLSSREIGDVRHENLAWLVLVELTVQMIRDRPVLLCRLGELPICILRADFCDDPVFPHQPKDAFMVHGRSDEVEHLHIEPAIPDLPVPTIVELFQEKIVRVVALFPEGVLFRTLEPGIVAASAHTRDFAECTDKVLQTERPDDGVDDMISLRRCQSVRFARPSSSSSFFSSSFSAVRYLMRASALASRCSSESSCFGRPPPAFDFPRRSVNSPSVPWV